MNILVTWVREGQPITTLLDFIELGKSHSGRNMAKALVDTLKHYGIEHMVSTSFSLRGKKNLPRRLYRQGL